MNEREETHACDLIERQAVLNELYDWEMCYTWDEHCREEYGAKYIVSPSDVIMKLPSAQPERKIELHGDESAIEILSELRSWFSCFDEKEGLAYHALSLAIRAINANHDARSERKRGEWIKNSPVTMRCNQCGFVIKDWDWHMFKYCPNCGADMRGEQDG